MFGMRRRDLVALFGGAAVGGRLRQGRNSPVGYGALVLML